MTIGMLEMEFDVLFPVTMHHILLLALFTGPLPLPLLSLTDHTHTHQAPWITQVGIITHQWVPLMMEAVPLGTGVRGVCAWGVLRRSTLEVVVV